MGAQFAHDADLLDFLDQERLQQEGRSLPGPVQGDDEHAGLELGTGHGDLVAQLGDECGFGLGQDFESIHIGRSLVNEEDRGQAV